MTENTRHETPAMIELRLAEDLLMRHMLIDHDGEVVA